MPVKRSICNAPITGRRRDQGDPVCRNNFPNSVEPGMPGIAEVFAGELGPIQELLIQANV